MHCSLDLLFVVDKQPISASDRLFMTGFMALSANHLRWQEPGLNSNRTTIEQRNSHGEIFVIG